MAPRRKTSSRPRSTRAAAGRRRTKAGTPDTSKYNATVHKTIVKAMRNGNHKSFAFRLAGIHEDTGFQWLRLGREKPAEYPKYAKLALDMAKAHAKWVDEMLGVVNKSARAKKPSSWLPAMTNLERREPQYYGRRDTTVVEGGDAPLRVNHDLIVDPETRELQLALLRRLANGPRQPGRPGMGDEPDAERG